MPKLQWDQTGQKLYETGVNQVALFPWDKTASAYGNGVAWSGITSITETPSGADAQAFYADNIKYLELRANEEYGGSIEAYMYPDEFCICDGSVELSQGVYLGQQGRARFCLVYKTKLGNDTEMTDHGYKLHIVYNATASPSQRQYSTINDSPDAMTFNWDFTTTGIEVDGYKPVSCITIDSTQVNADKLKALEEQLYGSASAEPTILMPSAVIAALKE